MALSRSSIARNGAGRQGRWDEMGWGSQRGQAGGGGGDGGEQVADVEGLGDDDDA